MHPLQTCVTQKLERGGGKVEQQHCFAGTRPRVAQAIEFPLAANVTSANQAFSAKDNPALHEAETASKVESWNLEVNSYIPPPPPL